MTQRLLSASALASLLALGLVQTQARAADVEKEQCFGIAKAGKNDCASVVGTHSCAGQSKKDMDPTEWKYVARGTCAKMGGLDAPKKQ